MATSPKIIIGLETEYANIITKNEYPINDTRLIGEAILTMLDAVSENMVSFEGTRGGIENPEEHDRAEEIVSLGDENINETPVVSEAAEAQRRGYSGHMLENGARCYEDCRHLEYSTPETENPRDALLAQLAGDKIADQARRDAEPILQKFFRDDDLRIMLCKNNSDGKGHSYAAHENYSLSPETFSFVCGRPVSLSYERWLEEKAFKVADERSPYAAMTLLFFVTRQILCGAGKTLAETGRDVVPYQISQRADFMERAFSVNTMEHRGIINLRDYPYADYWKLRRLHVICGDGNISELSIFLKCGLSGLFFMMLDSGFLDTRAERLSVPLSNPVASFRAVSRDLSLSEPLLFCDGTQIRAVDILQEIVGYAKDFSEKYGLSKPWKDAAHLSQKALDGLERERDKDEYSRSLDWVAKENVIRLAKKRSEKHKAPWKQHVARAIDLQYHDMDNQKSIAYLLKQKNNLLRLVSDEETNTFMRSAPENTRAWVRAEIIKRFGENIFSLRWNNIAFRTPDGIVFLNLPDPFVSKNETWGFFQGEPTLEEFLRRFPSELLNTTFTTYTERVLL